jgi:hypothetical protein
MLTASDGRAPCRVVPHQGGFMTLRANPWTAWLDTMPPKPDHINVAGQVEVENSGTAAALTRRIPSGINPTILMLDLTLVKGTGVVPALADAKYHAAMQPGEPNFTSVEIYGSGEEVITIDHIDVVS